MFPLENHLYELKEVLYEKPYRNEEDVVLYPGFELVEVKRIEDTINLRCQHDIANLFTMTPYYHRTPAQGRGKLEALNALQTQISFGFAVYKKTT